MRLSDIPQTFISQIGIQRQKIHELTIKEKIGVCNTEQQPQQCKFVDLMWFLSNNENTDDIIDEGKIVLKNLELLIFSYNINFGNIRINAYKDVKNDIHGNALFLDPSKLTTSATLYPAYIHNLHLELTSSNNCSIIPMEQIIMPFNPKLNPWHLTLNSTKFVMTDKSLRVIIYNAGTKTYYKYDFNMQQKNMLISTLDLVKQHGFLLTGFSRVCN